MIFVPRKMVLFLFVEALETEMLYFPICAVPIMSEPG